MQQSPPLVTMHVPPELYEEAKKVCLLLREKGFFYITFDDPRCSINFSYSFEGVNFVLKLGNLPKEYLPKGELLPGSGPSSNGTFFEVNMEEMARFLKEANGFYAAKSANREQLKARCDAFMEAVKKFLEKVRNNPFTVSFSEELEEFRKAFSTGDQELLEILCDFNKMLSPTFEELQEMANKVTIRTSSLEMLGGSCLIVDNISSLTEMKRGLEMAGERIVIDPIREAMKRCLNERARQLKLPSISWPQPKRETPIHPFYLLDESLPSFPTRTIDIPLKLTEGSREEKMAHELKEAGMLTKENIEQAKSFIREALELFQEMHGLAMSKAKWNEIQGSPAQILEELLTSSAHGVCLGEVHSEEDSKRLLIENLSLLAKKGVRFIALEGLPSRELCQPWLDQYFTSDKDEMSKPLKQLLSKLDTSLSLEGSTYSITELVKKAKRAGIRIVTIDTNKSSLATDMSLKAMKRGDKESFRQRILSMNFAAIGIINEELAKKPGKFFVLAGAAHIISDLGIPGLASLLGCPSLGIGKRLQRDMQMFGLGSEEPFDFFLTLPNDELQGMMVELTKWEERFTTEEERIDQELVLLEKRDNSVQN